MTADDPVAALLAELQENPLPGARYAYSVVKRRLDGYTLVRREEREALDRLAWCAVRYGLGRRTYVTADIAETVARVRDSLRDDTRRIIVTDIDRAEGRGPDGLGDAVDAGVWRGLRAALGDRP